MHKATHFFLRCGYFVFNINHVLLESRLRFTKRTGKAKPTYSTTVDKDCVWGGTIPRKRRMFAPTYSTRWGWRLLARRGSCHWPVGYEPWTPAAHACSSDRCPSPPCAARCQSFGALISQHSRCYPKENTEQCNSFQAHFRKTGACDISPLSCTSFLKIWVRHDPMTRLNTADFVKPSTGIHK